MTRWLLGIFLAASACSSLEGPHQAEHPDAATGLVGAPDARLAPDARPGPDARGAGLADAPPAAAPDAMVGPDAGPVAVAIETIAPATVTSGQKAAIRCELRDAHGGVAPWPATLVPTITIGDPTILIDKGGSFVGSKAGTTTARCSGGGFTDATPASVTVMPGAAVTATTTVTRSTVVADPADPGTDVLCVLRDAAGNILADASPASVQLANPAAGTLTGAHLALTLAGTQSVSCVLAGAASTAASVLVLAGKPATIQLAVTPAQALYKPGVTVSAQVALFDRYNNVVDASGATLSSSPAASAQPAARQLRFDNVGTYVVTARVATGTATGAPLTASVTVQVNDGAPTIECAAQMIVIDGSTNTWSATHVSGRASDGNGVQSATVNGAAVQLDANGNFATTVPSVFGVNAFHVTVTDGQGVTRERWCPYVAAAAYQPEATPPAGSVVLALGPDAIDDHTPGPLANSLGDIVDRALTPEQLASILDSYLDVGDRKLGRGCVFTIFCVDVYYEPDTKRVGVDTGNIDLGLGAPGLHTFLEATQFALGIRSEGILGLASSTGTASVSSASVDADFAISAAGGLLEGTYVDGSLATRFDGLSVDTDNFLVDLAAQIFPSLIDNVLNQVIQNLMSKVVDDLLHAIKVETFGISVVLPKLDGSGPVTVSAAGTFSAADANAERLRGVIAPVFVVTNGVPQPRASLGVAIQGGSITAPAVPLGARSVALGLHAEAVNDLVHRLWRNGFFDGKIDPATLAAYGIDLGDLADLFKSLSVSLESPLPPVVEIRPDGRVRFGLAGLRTLLQIPGESTPAEIEATGLFEGDAMLANGRITLTNITTVSLHVAALSLPADIDTTTVDQFDTLVTQLLQKILGQVLAQSLLGIPMPELHLPTKIGPLTLPAPVTLGLAAPALSVTSPTLLLQSDLIEKP
jgi:hypothetical protein